MEPCSNSRWLFGQDQEEQKKDLTQISKENIGLNSNKSSMLDEKAELRSDSREMSVDSDSSPRDKKKYSVFKTLCMDKNLKNRAAFINDHYSSQKPARRLKFHQKRKERIRTRLHRESESDKDKPSLKRTEDRDSMKNERNSNANGTREETPSQQWLFRRQFFNGMRPNRDHEEEEEYKEDPLHPRNIEKEEKDAPEPSDREMSLCTYCYKNFPADQAQLHEAACDMKKIPCEECGERILMDIYDFHVEECKNAPRLFRRGDTARTIDFLQSFFSMDLRFRGFENPGNPGAMGLASQPFRAPFMFGRPNTNRLETYEELLALDENKVIVGMSPAELEQFKTKIYKRENLEKMETEARERCNICLNDFEDGETLRELKCQHGYHKECIDTWLSKNTTCPNCKKFMK